MTATIDGGLKAVSASAALGINVLFFCLIFLAGWASAPPPEVPEHVMATVIELPRLGEVPPDPKALPRMVAPPAPPPPETQVASLSRELEEEEEKKKKKKALELKKKKEKQAELKRKKDLERKKKAREKRLRNRKLMLEAMDSLDDPRADEEDAPGFTNGHAQGRSTDPNSLRAKVNYLTQVSLLLSRQFEAPAGIPEVERRKLTAQVFFRIARTGHIKGTPKVVKSSGNRFFDAAALRTVRRFSEGSALKLPLPKDKRLRSTVLSKGLKPKMKCSK